MISSPASSTIPNKTPITSPIIMPINRFFMSGGFISLLNGMRKRGYRGCLTGLWRLAGSGYGGSWEFQDVLAGEFALRLKEVHGETCPYADRCG